MHFEAKNAQGEDELELLRRNNMIAQSYLTETRLNCVCYVIF